MSDTELDESELNAPENNEEDVEEDDDEEEREENMETSAPVAEKEQNQNGDNHEEDAPTRLWDIPQDNFDDFQFEPEEETQESMPADGLEDIEAKLAGLWTEGDKILTAKINKGRKFVCIDYPCIVKNVERAFATLEGAHAVSKVLSENGRMPLHFRPDDPYCKPVYANCTYSQNLLVRVRRRKKKKPLPEQSDAEGEEPDSYEYQLIVDGIVDRIYSFEAMCDFQYLPLVKNDVTPQSGDGQSYKEILSQIVPSFEEQRLDYLSRDMPLFLPPLVFSRRQVPVSFQFEDDILSENKEDVIETERKKRHMATIHVNFDQPGVPVEPHPKSALSLAKLPQNYRESGLEAVRKLFEERPLWNKSGLQVTIEPRYRQYLMYLLPMIAFYFTNGAWKGLWCRLGYDPRTDPTSKRYQIINFRIRKVPNAPVVDGKKDLLTRGLLRVGTDEPVAGSSQDSNDLQFDSNLNATYAARMSRTVKELVYVYHPGYMPPFRQMCYQVCDIYNPEVQAKLHENDGKESECTERDGWCLPDFTDTCRDILHKEVHKLQAAQDQKS